MRFHVLGIPHTVSTPEYSACAFTQKVVKLCRMLKMQGHTVIHYGHADSKVEADESVAVTNDQDLAKAYPGHSWRNAGFPPFSMTDSCYETFYVNAISAIVLLKQKGDFLLCPWGTGHQRVAIAHPDLIAVEPGIGYPGGTFAQFRVFESYAIMHAYQGVASAKTPRNDFWYDAVIPNAFDDTDFHYVATESKQEYLLFLGRLNEGKGVHIAADLATKTGRKLISAGQGDPKILGVHKRNYRGVVGPEERKELLAHARAVLCPSTFLEPFCGVQIEAMLSGTPVISSDWGAFAEYNKHGVTGYRCRTFEQFKWAVAHVDKLCSADCVEWAQRFTLRPVALMYDEYFASVKDIYGGKGWYAARPKRKSLANVTF